MRVKKSTGTLYWRDIGGEPLAESGLNGTFSEEYIFFNGRRIARRDISTGAVNYYFSDHLGSASVITDAAGTVQEESDYYPFGGEVAVTGSDPNRYKFTGKERAAESNLDYFGARHYASTMGRFMSVDRTRLSAFIDDPQTWNRHSYAHNNPLEYVDRNGKWTKPIHNEIIDEAFPNLTPEQRQILKDASAQQDSILGGGQANSLAFEHAMRAPGQTIEQAEAQYNDFVSGTEEAAQNIQVQFWLENPDSAELSDKALARFAVALHAVTDSTSPTHEGSQLWEWWNPILVLRHHLGERTINAQQRQAAVSAARKAFNNTFGTFGDSFTLLEFQAQPHEHVTHKTIPCGSDNQPACQQ
jgi:RHS repeat-associated protein